ncbi:hypothetical protein HPULCUR_000766 [Helicostylum pulchrum]|uniref:Uncharacterized protein n=1 Tax=Helicostylum pulchrum TaxID=562976 RepID=A0ABP9XKW7_9FUNG
MTDRDLNEIISSTANLFIDSVVDFEIFKIYVTSADVFLRNHLSIDDRAYFQNTDNMPLSPEAVIRENSYLGLTTYYELSVHWGSMEILLTGGFYVAGSSCKLLLGSSIRFWKHGELTSRNI